MLEESRFQAGRAASQAGGCAAMLCGAGSYQAGRSRTRDCPNTRTFGLMPHQNLWVTD